MREDKRRRKLKDADCINAVTSFSLPSPSVVERFKASKLPTDHYPDNSLSCMSQDSPGIKSKLRGNVYYKGQDKKGTNTKQWVPHAIKGR